MNSLLKKSICIWFLLALMLTFSGCRASDVVSSDAIPTLITPTEEELLTHVVETGTINRVSQIRGTIVPISVVDACFKYRSGYLKNIQVKMGDTVKKGDVLATLDDTEILYSIKQQEIKLRLAQLSYDKAVQENLSEFEVQKAALMLESEKVQMEQLQESLNNCVLSAEISGKVIYIADVKPSQYITGDLSLVTIADPGSYMVQCDYTGGEFPIGAQVSMDIDFAKDLKGEVVRNSAFDGRKGGNGQNIVVVKFIDTPDEVTLGEFVNIRYILPAKNNVIVVPQKAVKYGEGDRPYVRIVQKNGDILERYINTGVFNNDYIEVTNGLFEGEVVVIN